MLLLHVFLVHSLFEISQHTSFRGGFCYFGINHWVGGHPNGLTGVVTVALAGYFLLHESLPPTRIAGIAIIVAGVWWMTSTPPNPPRLRPAADPGTQP
jgi:drug/metabolite transporter (DMT)-like permease